MGRQKCAYHAQSVYDIPLAFFAEGPFKAVVLDLDNTLDPFDVATPSKRAKDLIADLKGVGLKVYVASNNNYRRVFAYCRHLDLDGFLAKAEKAYSHRIGRFLAKEGVKAAECLAIGDQVFTDRLMAKHNKMAFLLTKPLTNRDQPFTILTRLVEKPIRRRWEKKGLLGRNAQTL